MIGVIRIREGRAYFAHSYPLYTAPRMRTLSWSLPSIFAARAADGMAAEYRDGTVTVRDARASLPGEYLRAHIGDVDAAIDEEADIPRPVTRLQCRWSGERGGWEKLTRSGWVLA